MSVSGFPDMREFLSEFHTLVDHTPGEDVDLGAYVVERIFRNFGFEDLAAVFGIIECVAHTAELGNVCLLYTSPSPRDS